MAPSGIPSLRLYGLRTTHHDAHHAPSGSSPSPSPLATSTSTSIYASSSSESTNSTSFTNANNDMPPPGPAHYEARRALWLTPPPRPPRPPSPSTSRAKLEALLSQEGAIESDDVWNAGLRSVWKGLVGGGRLRRRLPLATVIKILQAGWVRDGTWPTELATGSPSPAPPPPVPVQVLGSGAT